LFRLRFSVVIAASPFVANRDDGARKGGTK